MAEHDWTPVGNALLGTWPDRVASWGPEALAFYCGELEARGVTPATAIVAIRSLPASSFPPSATELAAEVRKDPDRPTLEELMQGLYGPGGLFGFFRSDVRVSPWVVAFADDFGRDELRLMPIDDPDEGKWARKSIAEAWERFCEATEGRAVAEIAGRRGGGLSRVDVLNLARRRATRPQIEGGQ